MIRTLVPSFAENLKNRCLVLFAALLACTPLRAEQLPLWRPVVSQKEIGTMACGPCALANALRFGGTDERASVAALKGDDDIERVRGLIAAYGRGPSEAYPDRKRYREKEGMSDVEMLGFVNDYLEDAKLPKVVGSHLDRTEEDKPGSHLRAVHAKLRRSLDAGFPPIVILRSFIVKEVAKPKKGGDKYNWWGMAGHWVAVVDIPRVLDTGALSFTMKVADSWTGRIHDCFIHEEQFRNFTAAKGDDRKWVWPEIPQPYLIATLPAIPLGTKDVPWFLRSNIVLSYGIHRK